MSEEKSHPFAHQLRYNNFQGTSAPYAELVQPCRAVVETARELPGIGGDGASGVRQQHPIGDRDYGEVSYTKRQEVSASKFWKVAETAQKHKVRRSLLMKRAPASVFVCVFVHTTSSVVLQQVGCLDRTVPSFS